MFFKHHIILGDKLRMYFGCSCLRKLMAEEKGKNSIIYTYEYVFTHLDVLVKKVYMKLSMFK